MRRVCSAVLGTALAMLAGGCAVYQPQSAFQRAYREHALAPAPIAAGDVSAQWFGVSTLLLRDAGDAILIDGFFSRPDLWHTLFGRQAPGATAVQAALGKAGAGPVAAVFVAHAHHDHAQDAPWLALHRGATLHGSASVLNLARGYRVPEARLQLIRPNIARDAAGFRVTAVPTPHARSFFPSVGIDRVVDLPRHALGYSAGQNYSFLVRRGALSVLVVTSAGHEPVSSGDAFGDERAGLVFLAIGSLGKRDDRFVCEFWEASVRQRGARRVVLIHWDAFTKALDAPLRPFSRPFDDAERAYRLLRELAFKDDVTLNFVKPYDRINLSALAAMPRASVSEPRDCSRWGGFSDRKWLG